MLDYTKAAFKQTMDDFKRIDYVRNIVTQILYIVYLVYAIFSGTGFFIANLILFILAAGYFGFFLYMSMNNGKKQIKNAVKTIFTRCKQIIKLFTLGVTIYGLCLTANNVTPFSLILTSLMLVGWVLQVLFEVVFKFFINRAHFILEGMEADYQNITKPVRTVGNFFKKMAGKEVEEEKAPTKNRLLLDKKVAEAKAEREQKKREEIFDKKEQKEYVKQLKKLAKEEKRNRRSNLATTEENEDERVHGMPVLEEIEQNDTEE